MTISIFILAIYIAIIIWCESKVLRAFICGTAFQLGWHAYVANVYGKKSYLAEIASSWVETNPFCNVIVVLFFVFCTLWLYFREIAEQAEEQ